MPSAQPPSLVPPTSLDVTERMGANAAATGGGPRVSKADIEAAISEVYYVMGNEAAQAGFGEKLDGHRFDYERLSCVTICIIVMKNGFVALDKSAPVSAANFDPVVGRQIAYENAFRQLWPLMAFSRLDHQRGRDAQGR